MKKIKSLLALGFVLLAGVFTAFADANQIVVLHTNDHHGQVLPTFDGKGGLEYQAAYVKQIRQQYKNVIVLDAGDINTGSALSNMFAAEPDIFSYNKIGVDAVVFGNHEFDNDQKTLEDQIKKSEFTWLSANIMRNKKEYLGTPYIVKEYDGIRVGVFGLTTLRTIEIASPEDNLIFLDEIKTAKKMVKTLRGKEKCDVVILLGHLGDIQETDKQNTSIRVAENVKGIDLIIDGHAHSYFAEPKVVNGTPIVSANEKSKYVGTAVFTVEDKKITDFKWNPQEITKELFEANEEVTELLSPYVKKAEESLNEVLMQTTAEFEFGPKLTRYKEMPSGDLLCDAMMAFVKRIGVNADFAITNGGGIRYSLPAGGVTRNDILTMLPFENYVYVMTLKGTDVVELFNYVGSIKQGSGSFAQVSKEVHYTISYDDAGNGTLVEATVGGKPIDPNKLYKIVSHNYMAGGGDGYTVFLKSVDTFNASNILSEVLIEYAKTLGTVTPATDGRITVINGKY